PLESPPEVFVLLRPPPESPVDIAASRIFSASA
ncbi:hypothetical protein HEAFMP_HEAFMP_05765, partial [Dysosmobacter welbionis]